MKSLKESILTSNNASKSQQAILDFLNSRFCDFDNQYNSYKYTVGKDSKGWWVDVNTSNLWTYSARSNYCNRYSPFDGLRDFNKYVKNNPNNSEGWVECPEFRYRKVTGNLSIEGWQKLDSLVGFENITGCIFIKGCITNKNQKIDLNGVDASRIVILSDGFSIRGYDPERFFTGKYKCKNIEIR